MEVGIRTCDAVTTRREPGPERSRAGARRQERRKWPRWLVPTVSSKPSAVRGGGGGRSARKATPALQTRTSSGRPSAVKSAAKRRTLARLARSHSIGMILPGVVVMAAVDVARSSVSMESCVARLFSVVLHQEVLQMAEQRFQQRRENLHARMMLYPAAASLVAASLPIPVEIVRYQLGAREDVHGWLFVK